MPATLIYTLLLACIYLLKIYLAKPQKQLAMINQNTPISS